MHAGKCSACPWCICDLRCSQKGEDLRVVEICRTIVNSNTQCEFYSKIYISYK